MQVIRFILLIIAMPFLFFGLRAAIFLNNLGGYIALIIVAFLVTVFIFFNKIIDWIKTTTLGKITFIVVSIAIIFFIVVESLIIFSETRSYKGDSDAVIVLGAGLMGDRVSLNLKYRLDKAIEYLREHPNTIVVVSGGQGENELISEAEAMKRYLIENGINKELIIKEDKSTNTRENFRFSKEILDKMFEEEYVVTYVTSNFHVFRSGEIAKKEGMIAHGIAAEDVWYLSLTNHLREFISVLNMWTGVFE